MSFDASQPPDPARRPLSRAIRPTTESPGRALDLRHNQTPPEGILWSKLRAGRLGGLKFRRQHPLGPYIADFYCHEAAIVVEIDGSAHAHERRAHDDARDWWMTGRGVLVLRFTASIVAKDCFAVVSTILSCARERIEALEGEMRS